MRALRCTVEWIVLATRSLAGILLICSVALNFANIVGRYFFHSSLSWGEEGMLFFMVGCVFMGSGAVDVVWDGDLRVGLHCSAPARSRTTGARTFM